MVASKRKAKGRTPGLLSHTRSPHLVTNKPKSGLSAKTTASIIRTHHQLQKAHAQAVKAGDQAKAAEIQKQIEANGGLKKYQVASITGQSAERGGDSSRVLVDWLKELRLPGATKAKDASSGQRSTQQAYEVLEVGALSTTNACSQRRYLSVTRIDLHSQNPGIQQQDFMARPLPKSDGDRFDIISLSLVLNYVPDAEGRGEMLKRTCQFLRATSEQAKENAEVERRPTPCLFFVLPAPCVENSRYLDRPRLARIMESLGYVLLKDKVTSKLVYQLWKWTGKPQGKPQKFAKVEVNPGAKRNNFCVVLK
ncbi:putative methyltransferase-domain-containing protein [Phyllosticta citriasiana]|uniref:putative methyltransferase-domain-containing protein n=1 Tax=Phyllosticta citriasiana TaxID=595635 RepID=UPI0030FDD25B